MGVVEGMAGVRLSSNDSGTSVHGEGFETRSLVTVWLVVLERDASVARRPGAI